jgi:5'-nucleotidase
LECFFYFQNLNKAGADLLCRSLGAEDIQNVHDKRSRHSLYDKINMKKTILVDMDGVLSDVYAWLFDMHQRQTGHRLTIDDVAGKLEGEAFPEQLKLVAEPGFFRNLPVMQGSREGLRKLNDRHKVVIVSLATEFPYSLTDKQLWLNENFPFISWRQVVLCGDKQLVKAEIMIDDHLKNLDNFQGETLMFSQPHNLLIKNSRHRRVESWEEIEKLLLF